MTASDKPQTGQLPHGQQRRGQVDSDKFPTFIHSNLEYDVKDFLLYNSWFKKPFDL